MSTSNRLRALAARHHARRLPFELPGIGAEWQRWTTATQLAMRGLRRHAIAATRENPLCSSHEDCCSGVALWGVGLQRRLQGAITKRDMRTFFAGGCIARTIFVAGLRVLCCCCPSPIETGRLPPFNSWDVRISVLSSRRFPSHNLPRRSPTPKYITELQYGANLLSPR